MANTVTIDERDELKAKYEEAAQQVDALEGEVNELKEKLEKAKHYLIFESDGSVTPLLDREQNNRLAAAERLINFILNTTCSAEIREMVFAYREKKGGVK